MCACQSVKQFTNPPNSPLPSVEWALYISLRNGSQSALAASQVEGSAQGRALWTFVKRAMTCYAATQPPHKWTASQWMEPQPDPALVLPSGAPYTRAVLELIFSTKTQQTHTNTSTAVDIFHPALQLRTEKN